MKRNKQFSAAQMNSMYSDNLVLESENMVTLENIKKGLEILVKTIPLKLFLNNIENKKEKVILSKKRR